MTENELRQIVSQFRIQGCVEKIEPIGNGLINETLRVTTAGDNCPDYILQRINNAVFTDVDLLQHNIELVTSHIRRKLQERQDDCHQYMRCAQTKRCQRQHILQTKPENAARKNRSHGQSGRNPLETEVKSIPYLSSYPHLLRP